MATETTQTLEQIGKAWAEVYRGSGRLTGRIANEPNRDVNGEPTADWRWVGNLTLDEFDNEFQWQEHTHFHSNSHAEWSCKFCDENGWND